MLPCLVVPRPVLARVVLLSVLGASLVGNAGGQATSPATSPPQSPAPIVRARSRSDAPSGRSGDAPTDAAPLVARPPRPRPIDPRTFFGAAAPTGTGLQSSLPRRASTPATTHEAGAQAATGSAAVSHASTRSPEPTAEHAAAHPASTSGLNRTTVVLDPAHGGTDSGSRIGDNLLEKDVTLALAFRLRSLLTARGFTVTMTRDSDQATAPGSVNAPLTLDDRAGIANHAHGSACLLLHATGRGTGVHLYTSELAAATGEPALPPWLTAQAAWVPASQQLERNLSSALNRSHISLVSSSASVRPLDSLTCPALVIELAPEHADARSITDAGYQDRVAGAIASALVFWQSQVQPPGRASTINASEHTPVRHHHAAAPASEVQP